MEVRDLEKLKIHPQSYLIPDMRKEEYQELKSDINWRGIKVPLEINRNDMVLDGRHRLKAALELNLQAVPVIIREEQDEVEYMLKAAVIRRHLTDDQRAAMAALWKEKHKEPGKRTDLTSPERSGEVDTKHLASEKSAKIFNISRFKVDEATKVMHREPELFDKVHKGEMKLREAIREIELKEKKIIPEPPKGRYNVIVIDPPWPYGTKYDPDTRRVASPYPEMALEEIANIKIPAHDDCILWLWTTNRFMHDAYHLLERWGFEAKTILTWVKDRIGIGVWLRGQSEHCILATKGHPQIRLTNQTTIIHGKVREHSRKPDEFYKMAEELCLGKRRLDMFSREERDGWDQWGNEPERFKATI